MRRCESHVTHGEKPANNPIGPVKLWQTVSSPSHPVTFSRYPLPDARAAACTIWSSGRRCRHQQLNVMIFWYCRVHYDVASFIPASFSRCR